MGSRGGGGPNYRDILAQSIAGIEASGDFQDPEEKKKLLEQGRAALGGVRSAFDYQGMANIQGFAQLLSARLKDVTEEGKVRRKAIDESLKIQQTSVNPKLQQVRMNSFLGSLDARKVAAGM